MHYSEELELINIREEAEYPDCTGSTYPHFCDSCGAEMTQEEFEEFEDQCSSCVLQETGGLLEDNVYKELIFD